MNKRLMIKGNWYKIAVCGVCRKRMNESTRMHNGGICPICGHDSGCTICDTINIIVRKIYSSSWYKFWGVAVKYDGKDELSNTWIVNNEKGKCNRISES